MNELINQALLGLGKSPFAWPASLPEELKNGLEALPSRSDEQRFYRLHALAQSYDQAARAPLPAWNADWQSLEEASPAPESTLPPAALAQLQSWLENKNMLLLEFALKNSMERGFSLPPFFNFYWIQNQWHKKHPSLALDAHGQWLRRQWDSELKESLDEKDFKNASWPQQWHHLNEIQAQSQKLLSLLRDIWPHLKADKKVQALPLLKMHLADAEILQFLEQALQERSRQVQYVARVLLLSCPQSALSRQYVQWVRARLSFLPQHQQWKMNALPFEGEMKKQGIDELSPNKKVSDIQYQLHQLTLNLSMASWAEILQCREDEALEVLAQHGDAFFKPHFPRWLHEHAHPNLIYRLLKNKKHAQNPMILHLFHEVLNREEKEKILQDAHHLSPQNCEAYFSYENIQDWGAEYSCWVLRGLLLRKNHSAHDHPRKAEFLAVALDASAATRQLLQECLTQEDGFRSAEQQQEFQTFWNDCLQLHRQKCEFLAALEAAADA